MPTPSQKELAGMDLSTILQMRMDKNNLGNMELQKQLAPYEHRAFAREYVSENPIAAPVIPLMSAGYAIRKAVMPQDGETPASMEQVLQALIGTAEGASMAISNALGIEKGK